MSEIHFFGFLTLLLSVFCTVAVAQDTNSLVVLGAVFVVSGPVVLGMIIGLAEFGMWLEQL